MKRIIAATKKRWRLKRAADAAALANKTVAKAAKKAAPKKSERAPATPLTMAQTAG
jgi:hypothetical protein